MLQRCSISRVAGIFFSEPTKDHYLIEISKKAKLAHTSVKKHLKELKHLSIIKETIEKKAKIKAEAETRGERKGKKAGERNHLSNRRGRRYGASLGRRDGKTQSDVARQFVPGERRRLSPLRPTPTRPLGLAPVP